MRATVEKHESKDEIPDINIDIVKGNEDLTIRISDLGGGICRAKIKDLFTYHYSTAPEPDQLDGMAPLVSFLSRISLYLEQFFGQIRKYCRLVPRSGTKCAILLIYIHCVRRFAGAGVFCVLLHEKVKVNGFFQLLKSVLPMLRISDIRGTSEFK